jgi:hypothetical protein
VYTLQLKGQIHSPIYILPLYVLCGFNSQQGFLTDYTEWQRPISGVHSIMMEKSAQAGEGGGCAAQCAVHPPPSPVHTKLQ